MRKYMGTLAIIAVAIFALFVGVSKSDDIKHGFANFGVSWHNGEVAVANWLVGDQFVSTSDYSKMQYAYNQAMQDKEQLKSNKDAEILVLQQNLEVKTKALEAQTQKVAEFEQRDRERQNTIADKDKAIADLNAVIADKETTIYSLANPAPENDNPGWIEIAWDWTSTQARGAGSWVAKQF